MALWTALSTFKETELEKAGSCTACRRFHAKGSKVLFKTYQNPVNRNQRVRVILCNEECWQTYDFKYWENRVAEQEAESRASREERIAEQAEKQGYGDSAGLVADRIEADIEWLEEIEEREVFRNYQV